MPHIDPVIISAQAARKDSRKLRERARELRHLLRLRQEQLLLAGAELAATKTELTVRLGQLKAQS